MASRSAAVVTVSDGVSQGARDDVSGRTVAEILTGAGFEVAVHQVVPDERDPIATTIRDLAGRVSLVVTTGGTGFGPRDVTPEATLDVIDRQAPGLAEAMRAAGRASTPMAMLSREVVGSLGSTLIVNLPGSERAVRESLAAILEVIPHALDLLAGQTVHGINLAGYAPGLAPDLPHAHGHQGTEDLPEDIVVATAMRVDGNPPCALGQQMVLGRGGAIEGTLGCAEFDDSASADVAAVLASGEPATRTYAHELGTIEVLLQPHLRRPRLVVFSATPAAGYLLRWAKELRFDPMLVEGRLDRIRPEHRVGEVVDRPDGIDIRPDTYVVFTDHDAPGVTESLALLLRSPAAFIGVMGSRRHVGHYVQTLREQGFSDDELARIRSPLGLDLGGRRAEEIALSILAGLVAARHGAGGGWLDAR